MSQLKNIKNKPLNRGGGRHIEVCESHLAPSFKVINNEVAENIQTNPNNWFTFKFPRDTLHFEDNPEYKGARPVFTPVVSCVVSKDDLKKLNMFYNMISGRYVVIYHSSNGDKLIIGSREVPARFFFTSRDHKQNRNARNEYEFEFRLNALLKPTPFYTYRPAPTTINPNQITYLNGQPSNFLNGQAFNFLTQ